MRSWWSSRELIEVTYPSGVCPMVQLQFTVDSLDRRRHGRGWVRAQARGSGRMRVARRAWVLVKGLGKGARGRGERVSGCRPVPGVIEDPQATPLHQEPSAPKPVGYTRAWLAVFAGVMGCRAIGLALLPVLLVQAPVVLLVLSPILAHLVLTGPLVTPWVYFPVAIASSIVQGAIAYHFGLALGDKARIWLEGRGAATHALTTRVLRWMEFAAPIVLLLFAGPPICALAGVSRLRPAVFYPVTSAAQLLWVSLSFLFGAALTEQLELVYAFVQVHVLELSLVAIAWVGGSYLWRRQRQRKAAYLE